MRNSVMRIMMTAGIVAATTVVSAAAVAQPPDRHDYIPPMVPHCGGAQPPGGPPLPRPSGNGDNLFFRIVDSAGYDFEIWCVRTFADRNYEYRISFPDGTWAKIDACELFWGSNVIQLEVEGDSVITDTTANGAPLHRLRGRIRRYRHHNFNTSKDFHTLLDFATGKVTRLETRAYNGDDRHVYRRLTGTSESTIDIPKLRATGTPGASIAPVHGGTVVRSVVPDPAIGFCTAENSDSVTTVERLLSSDRNGPAVHFLKSAGIDSVRAVDGGIVATLRAGARAGTMSIVVPRDIGGAEQMAVVSVNDVDVPATQSVSGTLRTVAFELPAGATSFRIHARAEKMDWRMLALIPVGLLLGWLVGRRRYAREGMIR